MVRLRLLFSALLLACFYGYEAEAGFKPAGEYDIGPNDLEALCPLVKQYMDTGETPKPAQIKDTAADGPNCVYFKWNSCPPPNAKDKKKIKELALAPCGYYEMKKCSEKRRRRRRIMSYMNATEDEDPDLVQIDFMNNNDFAL